MGTTSTRISNRTSQRQLDSSRHRSTGVGFGLRSPRQPRVDMGTGRSRSNQAGLGCDLLNANRDRQLAELSAALPLSRIRECILLYLRDAECAAASGSAA